MPYSSAFGRAVLQFLRRDRRARRDNRVDLYYDPANYPSLTIRPASGRPGAIFVFSKQVILRDWILPDPSRPASQRPPPLPAHVEIIAYPPLMPAPLAAVIARESRSLGVPAFWVGDLDTGALTEWLVATRGGWSGPSSRVRAIDITWRGVSSEWLDRIEPRLQRSGIAPLRMTPLEVELWGWLRAQRVDWERVIGERAIALLDSGEKVELEGGMHPAIIGKAGLRDVRRWLFEEY